MQLKVLLTRMLRRLKCLDTRSLYVTTSKSMSTSIASVPMANFASLGDSFTLTNDGYIMCNFSGTALISGFVYFSNLNTGDRVMATLGKWDTNAYVPSDARPIFYATSGGTTCYISIPETPVQVTSGNNLMIRAGNYTASRGDVTYGVLTARRLYW